MKKIKASKLNLTRITVSAQVAGAYTAYRTYGGGCGANSYQAWCSQSCNSCQEYCATINYTICNGNNCGA